MRGAAGRGAAAAALIVTLGSTAPAFAAPWTGPSLHGGESVGSTSGTDSDHAVEHHTHPSGHESHNGHDVSAGGNDDAHEGHDSHDADASSSHGDDDSSEHEDAGHGSEPDTVSGTTKARVLGGFGVVNAAAVGGAFLLRRRDLKSMSKPGRVRGSRRDSTRRTR